MARDRYRRDAAGVGPDPNLTGSLTRLSSLRDFRVADGEPDIRGWEVRTLAGSRIGEVNDLLVDSHRGEVVLIDVDLSDSDQHINVPIRGVQLDRSRNCVIVDSGDLRSAREPMTVYGEDRMDEARALDAREAASTDEVVIDRRPIVEEVVVRRRVMDSENASEEERE
ncbi:MAG: PRC-barrel domain-containing protein [Gemmatimonadota bacterium]